MERDLVKLRRFALAIGLILITYVLAEVRIGPQPKWAPLGIEFIIGNPKLIPIGLAFASLYQGLSFLFYGMLRIDPPWVARKKELAKATGDRMSSSGYWLAKHPVTADPKLVRNMQNWLSEHSYPHVDWSRFRPETFKNAEGVDSLRLVVPFYAKLYVFLDDLDFSAPVWVNALALLLLGLRWAGYFVAPEAPLPPAELSISPLP